MHYVVFATDKPGHTALRQQVRPDHRQYLRDNGLVTVVHGGPTLSPESGEMNGTLLVVEAEEIESVEKFVAADPYQSAGLFESVEIRPWRWSLRHGVKQDG